MSLLASRGGPALTWLLLLASCGPEADLPGEPRPSDAQRAEALRRAQVWSEPAVPIERAQLGSNPAGPGAFRETDVVSCDFRLKGSQGRTAKFHCVLPDGRLIKVKYGRNNREVFAEVAASRLLAALGFGADRMDVVAKVRCAGCPLFPYPRLPWLDALFQHEGRVREFDWAVVEHPHAGRAIETDAREGWEWPELAGSEPAPGGASRAELDALRLVAVFLNHWDGKAANHRLVCLDDDGEGEDARGECQRPLAFLQDLGQTFGPRGVDLAGWSGSPFWKDAAACRLSMEHLPYRGAGFAEATVTEPGRRFLADRLRLLGRDQVRALFAGARFHEYQGGSALDRSLAGWVAAFEARVRKLADGPACP